MTGGRRTSSSRSRPSKRARYPHTDRKSTRLNSSHGYISYAVFCLKKKKKSTHQSTDRAQRSTGILHTPAQPKRLSHRNQTPRRRPRQPTPASYPAPPSTPSTTLHG